MSSYQTYLLYLTIFIDGLIISLISVPRIIYISKKRKLFDVPDNKRKIHVKITPHMGGMAIFFGYIIACSLFITPGQFVQFYLNHDNPLQGIDNFAQYCDTHYPLNYIIASSLILFLAGYHDDLVAISPSQKFLVQFVSAVITIKFAGIRLDSLHGLFGIYELHPWVSIGFSVIGCMFVTNAINLIDGIDGLAGSIGVLCSLALGLCLAAMGNVGAACIAFALMGATVGFLKYNLAPARIFMGDTGSLFMGFNIAILSIICVNSYQTHSPLAYIVHSDKGILLLTLSIIFVPIFDSFRVFINRARKGTSPFKADRTHLHHLLLDSGYTHSQAVAILITSNVFMITVALLMQDEDPNLAVLAIFIIAMALFGVLYYIRRNKLAKNQQLIEQRNKLAAARHFEKYPNLAAPSNSQKNS